MHAVLEELKKVGIIPVIKIDDVEKAVPLAKALVAGNIPCAEITFRTAQAEEAIRRINSELCSGAVPQILLGAGTVLTTEQVDKAVAAGAKYIVSPGFNPKVVAHCVEKGIPITPGCTSPSDIELAMEMGLEVVKFFPAEQTGGLDYIKMLAGPYSSMRYIPTGGISNQNIAKYIAYEKIHAVGGSWMAPADLINAGEFDKITTLCRESKFSLLGLEMLHIGINTENEAEATKAANRFSALFGFQVKAGASSIFAGEGIEIMKSPFLGKNGHIAIGTNSIFRGRAFFESQGVEFKTDSVKTDAKGNVIAVYFKEEIGGFAVHLLQKK